MPGCACLGIRHMTDTRRSDPPGSSNAGLYMSGHAQTTEYCRERLRSGEI